jgi:hypothetical protein
VALRVVPDDHGPGVRGRAGGLGRHPVRDNFDGDSGRRGVQNMVERRSGGARGGDVATFQDVKARVLAVRCAAVSHGWLLVWDDPAIGRSASGDRSAGCFPGRAVLIPGGAHYRSMTSFIPSESAVVFQRFQE